MRPNPASYWRLGDAKIWVAYLKAKGVYEGSVETPDGYAEFRVNTDEAKARAEELGLLPNEFIHLDSELMHGVVAGLAAEEQGIGERDGLRRYRRKPYYEDYEDNPKFKVGDRVSWWFGSDQQGVVVEVLSKSVAGRDNIVVAWEPIPGSKSVMTRKGLQYENPRHLVLVETGS